MKTKEILIVLLLIWITAMAWLTPLAVMECYLQRGYFAFGGEYVGVLTIPFAVYGIVELYMSIGRSKKHENISKNKGHAL